MQVTFKSTQIVGNKKYKAGAQTVSDNLAANRAFKNLVKSGIVIVHAKDANAQQVQAQKDEMNRKKSEIARKMTLAMKAKQG
jgi:hypothetical protein